MVLSNDVKLPLGMVQKLALSLEALFYNIFKHDVD